MRNKLVKAMALLDEAYVEEANPEKAVPMQRIRRKLMTRWIAVAACVCLLAGSGSYSFLRNATVYRYFDAETVASLFTSQMDSTNAYTKVYVPEAKYLYCKPIPDDAYLPIYEYEKPEASYWESVWIDEPVLIDQRQSDEQIKNALLDIKKKICQKKGVWFEDIKIVRDYSSYSKHGVSYIDIYFYNEAEHLLNQFADRPVSDYIVIRFDNFENYSGDTVSDTVVQAEMIRYAHTSSKVRQAYREIGSARRISLVQAEALLRKGYVFGGHICELCMREQREIDFGKYDFVGLTYIFRDMYAGQTESPGIPFYVFYKKIGTSENGNITYAKTYVPAVEVAGLTEYFRQQAEKHR